MSANKKGPQILHIASYKKKKKHLVNPENYCSPEDLGQLPNPEYHENIVTKKFKNIATK